MPGTQGVNKGVKRKGEVIWLIRAQDVTLVSKAIPSRRAADLQKAVPYALEEELAVTKVEDCQFAISRSATGTDEVTVAVANAADLQAGFEQLRQAGIQPTRVIPDVLALDWQEASWSVLVEDDSALVRTADMRGYAVERQNLVWALQQALASMPRTDRPERVRLWGDFQMPTDLGLSVEPVAGEHAEVFAQGLETLPSLNLRGLADSADRLDRAEWRYLYVAAGLCVAVLLTMLAAASWQLRDLERYKDELNGAITTLFRDAVPEVQRVVNPRVQLDQKLERLRSQQAGRGEMLSQLAAFATRLGDEEDFALESLGFQEGTFVLKFNTGSVQRLDAIKSDIERSTPYQVTIEAVDKQADFVTGTIRVRENG
jgi:general secretion pathway protein L